MTGTSPTGTSAAGTSAAGTSAAGTSAAGTGLARPGARVAVLATAQVFGGVGVAGGLAVNGLLAEELSGSTAWAGFAQTMVVLGAALLAVPLARLAIRHGRRPALSVGYLVGATGAALTVVSATAGSFPLLLLGSALFGGGSASGLQARYAAIDGVPAAHRGRSLSLVVWAATIGSVAGPNLAGPGKRLGEAVGVPASAGPFLFGLAGFGLAALLLLVLLRAAPPDGAASAAAPGAARARTADALRAVAGSPAALLGLVSLAVAHAVMVAVMVMTPLHLHHGGATLEVVGIVISVHIAGMYALSPVMGIVADRFGRRAGIGLGAAVLALACVLAATAPADAHGLLGVALTLLGVGWSACVVAGSTLLSESVPGGVRTSVQGLSDLVMGLVAAAAGALSGPVVAGAGYPALSAGALVLLLPVVALLVRPVLRSPTVGASG